MLTCRGTTLWQSTHRTDAIIWWWAYILRSSGWESAGLGLYCLMPYVGSTCRKDDHAEGGAMMPALSAAYV